MRHLAELRYASSSRLFQRMWLHLALNRHAFTDGCGGARLWCRRVSVTGMPLRLGMLAEQMRGARFTCFTKYFTSKNVLILTPEVLRASDEAQLLGSCAPRGASSHTRSSQATSYYCISSILILLLLCSHTAITLSSYVCCSIARLSHTTVYLVSSYSYYHEHTRYALCSHTTSTVSSYVCIAGRRANDKSSHDY